MKSFLTIFGFIAVIYVVVSASGSGCESGVSNEEFQRKHHYLNQRIDTLNTKLDQVQWLVNEVSYKADTIATHVISTGKDVKIIKYQIDTLRAGQLIIYDELTNFNSRAETEYNFFDAVIDWIY